MDGAETRQFLAKIILYLFGAYLFFTYIQRNAPSGEFSRTGGVDSMAKFAFTFFLNFCTQWALLRLQGLAGLRMQIVLLLAQLGFFAWTVYDFRFVYYPNMERDYAAYLVTPMKQFAIIFPLFLVMLFASTRER